MTATSLDRYRTWVTEPLDARPKTSVVIPAFNEELRILPTIGAIAAHMSSLGEPWELLIADDGSTDSTVELVRELNMANLTLLTTATNQGKGSAVRRGVQAACGEVVLFVDADQSTPIEQFQTLRSKLVAGADVVIGSRTTVGAEVANKSRVRSLFSAGLSFGVRRLLCLPIADTQCGFKLFTFDAAQQLFALQIMNDFSFDLEVLYLARKCRMEVVEVPVLWVDAPGSTVRPVKVAVEFVRDLAAIWINDRRGKYSHPSLMGAERGTT